MSFLTMPANTEAEEAILGAILLDPDTMERIAGLLKPEHYSLVGHQKIYRAAATLHDQGKPTGLMHVETWLNDRGQLEEVGGQHKLAALCDATVSSINAPQYAELVLDKYYRRRLIKAGQDIAQLGYQSLGDVTEVLGEAEGLVSAIQQEVFGRLGTESGNFEDITVRELMALDKAAELPDQPQGIRTNYLYDLDNACGGFQPGEFSIVAAATNVGKSIFGCVISYLLAAQDKFVYFASCEMSQAQVWARIVAAHTGVDSGLFRNTHQMSFEQISKIYECHPKYAELPINVQQVFDHSIQSIRHSVSRAEFEFKQKHGNKYQGLDIIVVDYLQLLSGDSENAPQAINRVAMQLKGLAGRHNCHVIALAQVDADAIAKRSGDKRPQLQDISYCKTAVNHADWVAMLYREAYYDPNCDARERNTMEFIVRKHRHQPLGTIKMLVDLPTCRLMSIAGGGRDTVPPVHATKPVQPQSPPREDPETARRRKIAERWAAEMEADNDSDF